MLCVLVLTWPLAAQQPAATATPVDVFAMTKSGVQIEVSERPKRGQLDIKTPFGMYHTPLDPVQILVSRVRDRSWRTLLDRTPDASLVPTIEAMSANGQISALLEIVPDVLARNREIEIWLTLGKLEEFGASVDPVPKHLNRGKRLEWLLANRRQARGPSRLLWNARYLKELPRLASYWERLEIRKEFMWSRGLKKEDVLERRFEIQLAAHFLESDPSFGARARELSLYGEPALRDVAAASILALWPEAAREYWVSGLLRGQDSVRTIAAQHLARHLPEYAPKPFAYLLAAEGYPFSQSFEFVGKDVRVVNEREAPGRYPAWFNDLVLQQREFRNLAEPWRLVPLKRPGSYEYLELESTVQLIRMSDELRDTVFDSLASLTDDIVPRSSHAWLGWYAAQVSVP